MLGSNRLSGSLSGSAMGLALAVGMGLAGLAEAASIGLLTNGVATEDENDIVAYLVADSRISSATVVEADISGVPSLATLAGFDAVLYAPDAHDHDHAIDGPLGDVLADYVDAGGGLVLTAFSWSPPANLGLQGRVMTSGYSPFAAQTGEADGGSLDLGASDTSHPAMANVNAMTTMFHNRDLVLDAGASEIARLDITDLLLAENASGTVLGLSAFPSPGTSRGHAFLTGDFDTLVVNSLVYVIDQQNVPEPGTAWLLITALGAAGVMPRRTGGWGDVHRR